MIDDYLYEGLQYAVNKALYRGSISPFKRCIDCLSQTAFDNRELAIIDNALSAKPVFKIKKI